MTRHGSFVLIGHPFWVPVAYRFGRLAQLVHFALKFCAGRCCAFGWWVRSLLYINCWSLIQSFLPCILSNYIERPKSIYFLYIIVNIYNSWFLLPSLSLKINTFLETYVNLLICVLFYFCTKMKIQGLQIKQEQHLFYLFIYK